MKQTEQSAAPRLDKQAAVKRQGSSREGAAARRAARPVRAGEGPARSSREGAARARSPYREGYYQGAPRKKGAPSAQARKKAHGKRRPVKRRRRAGFFSVLLYSAFAVCAALLIGFLLKTFVFEFVDVSGNAMYQKLLNGDRVLVTKFDYWSDSPSRGDIVAVRVDGDDSGIILRRVVGLPGETIEITDGQVYISLEDENGQQSKYELNERYIFNNYYTMEPLELGVGRYFLLSDDRTVMLDSRSDQVGVVSKNRIIGKVRSIVWPFDRFGAVS